MRVTIPIGVAYGSDTRRVHELISNAANANSRVLREPPSQVFFFGFGDSSLEFELRVFVTGLTDFINAKHELHMAINDAFNEHGIVIPFPQRDVHIRDGVPKAGGAPPNAAHGDDETAQN